MIDENKSQHRNTIIESHLDCGNLQYAVERPHSNLFSVCYIMFERNSLGDVHFIIVTEQLKYPGKFLFEINAKEDK